MRRASLLLLLGTVLAYAGPVVNFSSPGFSDPNTGYSLGFEFSTSTSVWITALGVYDSGLDGFSAPQRAALWASNGTLLASAYVSSTDPLIGLFRYVSITPVNLAGGASYILSSQGDERYTYFYASLPPAGWTVDPSITYVGNRWGLNPSLLTNPPVFPDQTDGPTIIGYFGANAEIGNPVPEPASLLLVGYGIAALLAWRRLKYFPQK